MMPLTMASTGETVTIQRINGKEAMRNHLAAMGFVECDPITIVSKNAGNLIVQVKDCRIALGKSMANRIMI